MDLRQLQYFCAVVEHGNFTRAARSCSVAQPSLSQQIISLEEELGEPLFQRHPRHIELTEAGEVMLRHARTMLDEADKTKRAFEKRHEGVTGKIHIGVIPTIAPYLVPTLLKGFGQLYPAVGIAIHEGTTSNQVETLGHGDLDFAITSDISAADRKRWSLHVREIFREKLLLAVPPGHPLAARAKAVAVAQIPRDEMILLTEGHCLSEQAMKSCRLTRSNEKLECGQMETLLAMVAAGMGVGIVPEMTIRKQSGGDVRFLRINDPEPERKIAIVRRKAATLSHAAETFLKYMREQAFG